MDTIESREEERNSAIAACEGRSLLDAAFKIVYYKRKVASRGDEPYAKPLYLSDIYPETRRKDLQVAEIKARELFASATDYSSWLMQPSKGIDILQHMAEAHPGFSKDCYESVMHVASYYAVK